MLSDFNICEMTVLGEGNKKRGVSGDTPLNLC